MPNTLDSTGLTVKSTTEVITDLVTAMQNIYGPAINVAQNSPDGQLINIFAQATTDVLELLLGVYNSFSPASAYGILLDQRVALNGLARKQGSFTLTNVAVTVNQAVTLSGLDSAISDPNGAGFTIRDNSGNSFILVATTFLSGPGTTTLSFRSQAIGSVQTTPNTITNQVTQVLGVTAVNNPTVAAILGVDEETDAQLRTRHSRSFNLGATGPADAIQAGLLNLFDVTDAFVVENTTAATVGGVPAHSIWVIVENGTPLEIASAIYQKKAPGCGMIGAVSQAVLRVNGTSFLAYFDRPIYTNLYVRFTITPRTPGLTFDKPTLAIQLAAALIYRLNQTASIGDVVQAMAILAPQAILSAVGVSTDGTTWLDLISTIDAQHKFVAASARITIS